MPPPKCQKNKNLKNLNKQKKVENKMETDQSSNEYDEVYEPVVDLSEDCCFIDQSNINEEFLVDMINLILSDSHIRNVSLFSYALLIKLGINVSVIKTMFNNIGLQRTETCRDNLIKYMKYGLDGLQMNSGGNIKQFFVITFSYRFLK